MSRVTVKHLLDHNLSAKEAEAAADADAENRSIVGDRTKFKYDPKTGYGRATYEVEDGNDDSNGGD